MRRRVWSETLTFDEVVEPSLVAALARHRVDLLLAVRPWQLDDIRDTVRRLQGHGVYVAVWPMLGDADGRWASVASASAFVTFTDALLDRVPFANELAVDLEPPLAYLARWKAWRPTWRQTPSPWSYSGAKSRLVDGVERWRRERRVTTAVLPFLAFERGGQWMQRALGTPATALAVDAHSVMAYTSLFEGWSRGFVDRKRAETLLVATARFARARFGTAVSLSLGTVGTGAFGDEPSYRSVAELQRDVAIARRAGIAELAVFDLGGMVRRGPVEAWLEAFGDE